MLLVKVGLLIRFNVMVLFFYDQYNALLDYLEAKYTISRVNILV
jgi:hypothetical protein